MSKKTQIDLLAVDITEVDLDDYSQSALIEAAASQLNLTLPDKLTKPQIAEMIAQWQTRLKTTDQVLEDPEIEDEQRGVQSQGESYPPPTLASGKDKRSPAQVELDARAALSSARTGRKVTTVSPRERWITVQMQESDEKDGKYPVPVAFNGKQFTIPRGRPIAIPPEIELILRLAVQSRFHQDDSGEMVESKMPTFPYQILEGSQFKMEDHTEEGARQSEEAERHFA